MSRVTVSTSSRTRRVGVAVRVAVGLDLHIRLDLSLFLSASIFLCPPLCFHLCVHLFSFPPVIPAVMWGPALVPGRFAGSGRVGLPAVNLKPGRKKKCLFLPRSCCWNTGRVCPVTMVTRTPAALGVSVRCLPSCYQSGLFRNLEASANQSPEKLGHMTTVKEGRSLQEAKLWLDQLEGDL